MLFNHLRYSKTLRVGIHVATSLMAVCDVRRLRERLRLLTLHWPSYPNAVGIILGDFNICEPEEGRFNVWNQTFTDGDTGKAALFHSFFPHVLEIAQPDCTMRDSSVIGIIRTLSRIDRIFINFPVAEARDFHCYSHVFENLGNQSIPGVTRWYVLSFESRLIKDNRANTFQVGCPNISFSVLSSNGFRTATDTLRPF